MDHKPGDISIRITDSSFLFPSCQPNVRLTLVVLSIGVGSHFMNLEPIQPFHSNIQLYLDSVMDNLLPAARPYLLDVYKNKDEADVAWEVMVSSRLYGLAFGCFLSICLSRRCDRKFPVVLGTALDVIGILLTLFTVHVRMGMIAATFGRFINGCGQGIVQTSGSVMLTELPPQKRGLALATLTVWACLGELAGMVISLEEFLGRPSTWHIAMGAPLILLVPALWILAEFLESPRYILLENREYDAKKSMMLYEHEELIDENGNALKLKPTTLEKSTLAFAKERFENGQFTRPLLLALFVQCFVHLDDWLWISYSTHIFGKYGLATGTAQRASLLMSLPQAIISLGLLSFFERFTRRTLLLAPTIVSVMIGILVIFALQFGSALLGLPLGATLAILASIDLSAAAISGESAYAVVPELFLPNDKILGTAIVGIAQNVFGGMLTTVLLTAVNKAGATMVLVPFIAMNIVYVIVNYLYLPETSKKTAHEVSQQFSESTPGKELFERIRQGILHIYKESYVSDRITLQVIVFMAQLLGVFLMFQIGIRLCCAVANYMSS